MIIKKVPFIDLYAQYKTLKKEIDFEITKCIENSAFIRSNSISEFENSFSKLNNSKYCVSCASGTDALYIAMKSLNIKPGDEVITTGLSWISTSETISQAGGKVIFSDICPSTYCINPEKIESLITKKTVGIIPVHLYGQPCEMSKILDIAKNYNLWIIEDCAQAHLGKIGNKLVGKFGNISTFSFYPSKNLGAMGDAGCIITDQVKLANWARLYSQHGGKNKHEIEGINSRMDGLQASILNVKIGYLESWTKRRIRIAQSYLKELEGVGDLCLPYASKNTQHVYHLFTIFTKFRDQLRDYLSDKGIGTTINYPKPLPLLPCYSHLGNFEKDFPVSDLVCKSILSLPLYPELKDEDQYYIISAIKDFFNLI